MKKLYLCIALSYCLFSVSAQSWNITGNSGLTANNFLGTTDKKDLIFKVNNIERGRLIQNGVWRFGSITNNMKIDSSGNLSFAGSCTYKVALNKYVFQSAGNPAYGLFLDSVGPQYKFTNKKGQSVFSINTANGNGVLTGTLKIGKYILPATDGLSGQVLKTDGAGKLAWADDNGNSYTAGNGIVINGNVISTPYITIDGTKLNSGFGALTLNSNSSGADNTATGYFTLYSNTTGSGNTATGFQSLYLNTTGNLNTATGYFALYSNTAANENTAYGYQSLFSNTVGAGNTALGSYSLVNNVAGYQNTAVGDGALYSDTGTANTANGFGALFYNQGGSDNVAVGFHTLLSNQSGNNNTAIGFNADVTTLNLTNATAIGSGTQVDASNKVRIGNTAVTSIGGQVGWTSFSDGRYKKNIKEDVQGLKFINLLRPITYTVDVNALNAYYDKNKKHDSASENLKKPVQDETNKASAIIHNGFIAQDVEKAAAALHYNFSGVDKPQTEDGLYGLRYADFVVPLVKAVQELSRMNDDKDARIDSLENQNKNMQKQFEELKTLVLRIQQVQQQCDPCSAAVSGTSAQQNVGQQYTELADAASLEQNVPNPFTNTTSIGYYLPQFRTGGTSAKIVITDRSGKALQQLNLTNSGKGTIQVNASGMASGAYYYSLYVDGKVITTKRMVLAK